MKEKQDKIKKYLKKNYGISAEEIKVVKGGVANWNYRVATADSKYLFKIYRYRSAKQTEFETRILNILANKRFPSPKPIRNNHKKLFGSFNKKPCVLFKFVEGNALDKIDAKIMYQIGRQVGRLHQLLGNKQETVKRENWDEQAIKKIFKKYKNKILQKKYPRKKEIMSFLEEEFEKTDLPDDLPRGLTHQDIKPDNIIVDPQGKLHFIDFDNMYRGKLLIDMMTTLIWSGFKNNKLYLPYVEAYVKGYNSQRKLTKQERKVFTEVMKFRLLREAFIWIWLYSDYRAQKLCNSFIKKYKNL